MKEVTSDSGVTWSATSETSAGTLIQADSTDCGYGERWSLVSGSYACSNANKYQLYVKEVTRDSGTTWSATSETSAGTMIESNSYDCGYRTQWSNSGTTCQDGSGSSGCNLYNIEVLRESRDYGSTWGNPISSRTRKLDRVKL